MADPGLDVLVADLRTLGRSVATTAPDERVVATVLARVQAGRPPRSRRPVRLAVAAVVAALLATLAAPPVRAAVADWIGFGALLVRLDPDSSSGSSAPPPPRATTGLPLDVAVERVAFVPVLPRLLGRPDGVEVSPDRRVLSMTWDTADGPVRLDQIDARLDYVMAKTAPEVEFTTVAGDFALWFDRPHEVAVVDDDGTQRTERARLAGHTLIWARQGTTLRLEGDLTLARARSVADSAEPLPAR